MAIMRCPRCGKPNPDFLELCQYCDAPLQAGAVGAASAPASPHPAAEPEAWNEPPQAQNEPDWLWGGTGGDTTSDATENTSLGAAPQNEPDWLWSGTANDNAATEASPAAEVPDWLREASAPAGGPPAPAAGAPDWLRNIRGEEPAALDAVPADDIPDWMRDVAPPASGAAAIPDWLQSGPAASVPDWSSGSHATNEPQPASALDDDLPDWMRGDAPPAPLPVAPPTPSTPIAVEEDDSLPEWMRGAATPAPLPVVPPTPATPIAAEEDDSLPEWMRGAATPAPYLGATSSAPAAPPPADADDDLPEWMRGSAAPVPPPFFGAETASPAAKTGADVPDWLNASTTAAAQESEVPAWLSGEAAPVSATQAGPPPDPGAKKQPPTPSAAEGLPDWLSAGATAAPLVSSEAGGLPDWLSAGAEEAPSTAGGSAEGIPDWLNAGAEAAPFAASGATENVPDWLSDGAEVAPPAATPPAVGDEGVPDWLQSGAEPMAAAAGTPAGDTPDWLQGGDADPFGGTFGTQEAETSQAPSWLGAEATSTPTPSAPANAAPSSSDFDFLTPDWMKEEPAPATGPLSPSPEFDWQKPAGTRPPEPNLPSSAEMGSEGSGDWLSTLRSIPPSAKTPDTGPAPAWLETVRQTPTTPPAVPGSEPLPGWLNAMRPVDDTEVSDQDDGYQENVGILAGIRGILRAEPAVAKPVKSTPVTQNIAVSEAHKKQLALLEALLEEAAAPRPVAKPKASPWPLVERWLVVVFVVLAVGLPWLVPGFIPAPTTIAPETKAIFDVVENLPTGSTALVAFEYEIGQRGELDPAAAALIAHLLRRNVYVASLSTNPYGAGAAQAVLPLGGQLAQQSVEALTGVPLTATYAYGFHYVNLGYLPGGPVGLTTLAADPRTTFSNDFTRRYSADHPLWQDPATPVLAAPQKLSDFALLVLVADNPESVRAWLEQVQPTTPNLKMVALVSASAEPLVRPYVISGQLAGLLSGLGGAAKYEQQAGITGPALQRWGPMNAGLLVAAIFVGSGTLIFGARGLLRRLRPRK